MDEAAILPCRTPSRRGLAALLVVVVQVVSGCSSPTPTSPSTPLPAQNPPPPPAASALTIRCPADVAVAAPITSATPTAPVAYTAPVTAGGVSPVVVSCTRPSGSGFGVGTTSVQCTATDAEAASAACSFTVTVAAIPQLSRTRFLAFGDSLTAGEVTQPSGVSLRDGQPNFTLIVVPSASYPAQLLSLLRARYTTQASTIEVATSSVPGEWAQDGVKRLPGVLANLRPEAVFLLEGYNDLGAEANVNAAWLAIDTMAKEIRNRGARAFLATLPPPGIGPKALPLSQVTALNTRIRSTAVGEGAVLVDIYQGLLADIPRYMGPDGLHPTELGYQRMAELFLDAIRIDLEVR
jgi:lysophospholipase L1-like esterase